MHLFLDTNILIDLLANRKPFAKFAYEIFKYQKSKKWTLYTSSIAILTTYYIVSKEVGDAKARKAIKILLNRIEVLPIEKSDLQNALITKFKDYEDSIQHECAKSKSKIKYIVTRKKKDYKFSTIEVISSEELFLLN